PVRRHLGLEVLRAVLADHADAGLGENGKVVDGHVLGRGEYLDLPPRLLARRSGPAHGSPDLLPPLLEVRAHRVGAQGGDQLNHATPAWRPARAPSRRCEKKSRSQIVQMPRSCTRLTPAASSRSRAMACRSMWPAALRTRPSAACTSAPTS